MSRVEAYVAYAGVQELNQKANNRQYSFYAEGRVPPAFGEVMLTILTPPSYASTTDFIVI